MEKLKIFLENENELINIILKNQIRDLYIQDEIEVINTKNLHIEAYLNFLN